MPPRQAGNQYTSDPNMSRTAPRNISIANKDAAYPSHVVPMGALDHRCR